MFKSGHSIQPQRGSKIVDWVVNAAMSETLAINKSRLVFATSHDWGFGGGVVAKRINRGHRLGPYRYVHILCDSILWLRTASSINFGTDVINRPTLVIPTCLTDCQTWRKDNRRPDFLRIWVARNTFNRHWQCLVTNLNEWEFNRWFPNPNSPHKWPTRVFLRSGVFENELELLNRSTTRSPRRVKADIWPR